MQQCILIFSLITCRLIASSFSASTQTDEVDVEYSMPLSTVTLHSPVLLSFNITNKSDAALQIDLGQDRKEALRFSVLTPQGTIKTAFLPRHAGLGRLGQITIAPGGAYGQTVVVNEWFDFPNAGSYEIGVHLEEARSQPAISGLDTRANLQVRVLPANEEQLKALCEELLTKIRSSSSAADIGAAAQTLSYVNDPLAITFLIEAAKLHSGMVAVQSTDGLRRIGGSAGAGALISLMREGTNDVAMIARSRLVSLQYVTEDMALKEQIRIALQENSKRQ